MSYLVLARKWRPQVFEDVVGQRPITQTLQNAISQNRVAHGFLFAGARGVGKTSTARILAKALNCETGPRINPCNQCKTCQEISAGTALDVIEIDGASNRGIDEIRELKENIRYTPAKSRYKIYIIDEVHMLTREAFNALLKTLEEPPPHILFVFATTEPHKIPATILSRCQRYDFKRIPLREIIECLKRIIESEKVHISQRGLLSIAQESEGSLRDAQSLLDQVISYGGKDIRDEDITEVLGLIDRKILYDTIEAIANRDPERCMEMVEHVYHYGYDLQHYCRELLQYLRNLILIKVSQHPEGLLELPEEELGILKRQAERFQSDQLDHLFNLLLKGEGEVTQSTFPRTMLEMALIRMATLRPILPIDEILKKLEVLEKAQPSKEGMEDRGSRPSERNRSNLSLNKERIKGEFQKLEEETQKGKVLEKEERSTELTHSTASNSALYQHVSESAIKTGAEKHDSGSTPACVKQAEQAQFSGQGVEGLTETIAPHTLGRSMDSDNFQKEEVSRGESPKAREEAWRGLVDFTRARNPILGSFLVLGDLVHLSNEKIEIGFEKDSFHYERILEKENRGRLESICQEYFQRKAKVIISSLDRGVKSKGREVLEEGVVRDELGKPLERRAGENSLIQEALHLFNGKIIEG
jgi:DNA polymerase III subunit gamma/tau